MTVQAPLAEKESGFPAFEAILAPVSIEQFLSDSFGRSPLHLNGASGRFADLLDWDGLAELFETRHLRSPQLEIVRAGKPIPAERYQRPLGAGLDRIDGGALSLLFDTGATAIVNHIDNLLPSAAALADEIGDCLRGRIGVNLYASWRAEHGFNAHWDYHDVIVLQLAGRKEWSIWRPTRPNPLINDAFESFPKGTPPDTIETLEDGDVLYVPRGWIHAPKPLGSPSMHLTIGIVRPNGAGFLSWLAKELENDAEVRADIPWASDRSAIEKWKGRIAAIVGSAIDNGAPERYRIYKDAKRGARPRFSFPDFGRRSSSEWTPATTFRAASAHRLTVKSQDGGSFVTAAGRDWPCNTQVVSALGRITSTNPVMLRSLEEGLSEVDRAQLRQLLALMTQFGEVATGSAA